MRTKVLSGGANAKKPVQTVVVGHKLPLWKGLKISPPQKKKKRGQFSLEFRQIIIIIIIFRQVAKFTQQKQSLLHTY
jgi:hypothetical protein